MKTMKRQTNEKLLVVMLVLGLVLGLTTGCGASKMDSESAECYTPSVEDYGIDSYGLGSGAGYEENMEEAKSYDMADDAEESVSDITADNGVSEENVGKVSNSVQKIIKRYDYRYETEHFDDAYEYLKEQITAYNGYISSSEITGSSYSDGYRTLYLTARIPSESSEEFVSGMGQLGVVVRQSETAEDVTLQYSDTESRIASLKTEQESLNKLLEQADSLETIIALQDRLTEVRYELESYQSKKKLYDDLISYSTVDITLEEVNYTVEADDGTFFSRITKGLERSLRDIGAGLTNFVEWAIINLPYFILWGAIIFVIVKVIRTLMKRRREKKLKKQQLKMESKALNHTEGIQAETEQKEK